ncbi:Probable RNA-directed DNA polymerase from transposon BS [Eumeta japonica]|uniref:Probable RNA-directed DNA polymerase from transposon BS n=1 Tax=Eumeta variegata TaxID=151549 RepID=A0A4C1TWJ2_EUMVA|nr:Probable RNA-directed DNA polymerase from transposon BS [Eumeta japonica]
MIFRDTTPRLQRAIDELTRWLRLWRIDVNPDKSAAIRFDVSTHKKKFKVPYESPTLRIANGPIPWQHNLMYLEVTLEKHLHFRDHVARVRKLAQFYQSRLNGMIGRKSKMSLRKKRTLCLMCIRKATDAHWCVKNSVLHGDLQLVTINKCMKKHFQAFFRHGTKPPQSPHSLSRDLRAGTKFSLEIGIPISTGTPFPKKATEYSFRSAGRLHFRARKAHRS